MFQGISQNLTWEVIKEDPFRCVLNSLTAALTMDHSVGNKEPTKNSGGLLTLRDSLPAGVGCNMWISLANRHALHFYPMCIPNC